MVGQVTTPLLLTPPLDALTNEIPNGKVSLTTIFEAVLGPKFVTVIV